MASESAFHRLHAQPEQERLNNNGQCRCQYIKLPGRGRKRWHPVAAFAGLTETSVNPSPVLQRFFVDEYRTATMKSRLFHNRHHKCEKYALSANPLRLLHAAQVKVANPLMLSASPKKIPDPPFGNREGPVRGKAIMV